MAVLHILGIDNQPDNVVWSAKNSDDPSEGMFFLVCPIGLVERDLFGEVSLLGLLPHDKAEYLDSLCQKRGDLVLTPLDRWSLRLQKWTDDRPIGFRRD